MSEIICNVFISFVNKKIPYLSSLKSKEAIIGDTIFWVIKYYNNNKILMAIVHCSVLSSNIVLEIGRSTAAIRRWKRRRLLKYLGA